MGELTYTDALNHIIEHSKTGYSIRSQDRLWIVFIFDEWSKDSFRYNRLYPCGVGAGWGDDLTIDGVLVWTSRREAEDFAARLRDHLDSAAEYEVEVYVMNLGDDARREAAILGTHSTARRRPKFKGSERAWKALDKMHAEWMEWGEENNWWEDQR